ncbi:hypothetical protein ARMGADRAFT_1023198 [Armillaria gallica]|uniref:Uncharacterized protein n=1 Tax=Armillaria gallica TaxID=47427 RepID=A0A2H3E2U5_ARMGA|nr:hypothetical protein ARMGADRAFT_1023198 [Armillaria gallica]
MGWRDGAGGIEVDGRGHGDTPGMTRTGTTYCWPASKAGQCEDEGVKDGMAHVGRVEGDIRRRISEMPIPGNVRLPLDFKNPFFGPQARQHIVFWRARPGFGEEMVLKDRKGGFKEMAEDVLTLPPLSRNLLSNDDSDFGLKQANIV